MTFYFEKASEQHMDAIFSWLKEPAIQEFWDATEGHKQDIVNFVEGRAVPSDYCGGKYVYWIASENEVPFAMIMTIQESIREDIGELKLSQLSRTGNTYSMDYMIGNPEFFGKGYGAKTLEAFLDFFRSKIDEKADTFLIDPTADNPRAKHVYEKAGFEYIADFVMEGDCSGAGKLHYLLVRRFMPKISLVDAGIQDHKAIQNMGRFYVYEMSRYCGLTSEDWAMPQDGLYECFDLKSYFQEESKKAYLVRVYNELAGFVLVDDECKCGGDYNMGEFFVLARFQKCGIGIEIFRRVLEKLHGSWEITVIPENKPALSFWDKAIRNIVGDKFSRDVIEVDFDEHQPKRVLFRMKI